MKLFRPFLLLTIALAAAPALRAETPPAHPESEASLGQVLTEGIELAKKGRQAEAIALFDQVASSYENRYRQESVKLYSARASGESMLYLLEASSRQEKAKIVSSNWAYAYYFRSYALMELGRRAEARVALTRALALAPRNAQFLSELGNHYQQERNWAEALKTFEQAEKAAQSTSPPSAKNADLGRALRGQGYVLVEQNQLDEAEKRYRRCLELDANDRKAAAELGYIEKLRTSRGQTRP